MSDKPLTTAMEALLGRMRAGEKVAYWIWGSRHYGSGINASTVDALERRGLVKSRATEALHGVVELTAKGKGGL